MNKSLLVSLNSHWSGQLLQLPVTERLQMAKLKTELDTSLMTYLIGPRRTGKSIALKQALNHLLRIETPPTQILFYEFTPNDNLEIIWEIYNFFRQEVANLNAKIYLFLDEIQFVKGYENVLKIIYDSNPNLKIIFTGSLSLSYKRKTEESLDGRFLPLYF